MGLAGDGLAAPAMGGWVGRNVLLMAPPNPRFGDSGSPAMGAAMLTIDGITVRLGGRPILERASAAIPQGARVGLIGRNGAGKSTLMKAIIGEIEPDEGEIARSPKIRIGYIAQEAPSGSVTPEEAVLAADVERTRLLAESESCTDPHRLGDVHERLLAIDAYSAPSRAARILTGLGFDEEMQRRPLDTFSGGWKMRVALGALLFSEPDVLLLDEPSNHLDLEATLWLESFLRSYPATLLLISHERDLLNKVVDHIVHLQGGRLTLYSGGYDSFERQRAERAAQLGELEEMIELTLTDRSEMRYPMLLGRRALRHLLVAPGVRYLHGEP